MVLTIGALMAAVALPRVSTLLRPDIDRTTRRVALAIRDQRSTAMRTGYTVSVDGRHGAAAASATVPSSRTSLSANAGLRLLSQRHLDGRARWCWRRADGRRAVNVDWLTGRVTVGPAP